MELKDDACPGCGEPVGCAIAAGQASCWCMQEPRGLSLPLPTSADARCYCAACLARLKAGAPDFQAG